MYGKKMSLFQKRYAQYYNAKYYDGAVPIFDAETYQYTNGFWMEFSIQPTSMSRIYRVLLVYVNGHSPYSYIIDPDIIKISTGRTVPHLYSQVNQQLCLTYPPSFEWNIDKLITSTYIPWISLWLFYYENWLLADEWRGGGKHPDDDALEISQESPVKDDKKRKKKKPFSSLTIANNIYYKCKSKYEQVQNESLVVGGEYE